LSERIPALQSAAADSYPVPANRLSEFPQLRDRRLWLLVAAAIVIVGLCVFRATRTYTPQSTATSAALFGPAPPFELYDENSPSHLVRLSAYLGRQRVFVVFYDGLAGAHRSHALDVLRTEWPKLRKADVYVMAISKALPQENRKDMAEHGHYPFSLLSDVDLSVHRAWGRYDEERRQPLEGAFLVDRKGEVAWSGDAGSPEPISKLEATVAAVEAN
jgi:peroxiredoxin